MGVGENLHKLYRAALRSRVLGSGPLRCGPDLYMGLEIASARDTPKAYVIWKPREVEADVDPITLRTSGRAYVVFATREATGEAEQALLDHGMRVSFEEY